MSNSRVNLGAGGFQKTTKRKPKKAKGMAKGGAIKKKGMAKGGAVKKMKRGGKVTK
tara:strand:+ start:6503 stop:6670 length:168 start_codon:yes stop_codon:yes gene_type:complete